MGFGDSGLSSSRVKGLGVTIQGLRVCVALASGRMHFAKLAMKDFLQYADGSFPNWPFELLGFGFRAWGVEGTGS